MTWTHAVPEQYYVRGVSSYYNRDGELSGQWVKSSISAEEARLKAFDIFKTGLMEDVAGKAKPTKNQKARRIRTKAAFYMCGDHHLGLKVWSPETGDDSYDIDISKSLLFSAVDKLAEMSSHCSVGVFVNLGDFMHAKQLKEPDTKPESCCRC
jgi:hypothetical protein